MPSTSKDSTVYLIRLRIEIGERCLSQRQNAQRFRRSFALLATLSIFTIGQMMFDVAICYQDRDIGRCKRNRQNVLGTAINEHESVFLAKDAAKLVHDAAGNPGISMFGLLTQ
jgi:hypothetical protein